jgi:hypothetical protein
MLLVGVRVRGCGRRQGTVAFVANSMCLTEPESMLGSEVSSLALATVHESSVYFGKADANQTCATHTAQ